MKMPIRIGIALLPFVLVAPLIAQAIRPEATQISRAPLNPALPTLFVVGDSTASTGARSGWGDPLADYFDLTVKMLLALGVVFEMPVAMLLLGKIGIVRAEFLQAYRRHAFLVISVGAAILTPSPDAFTLLLVMIPLYLLYEASIIGVRWVQKPLS